MNEFENVQEDIEVGTKSLSVDIPLRVSICTTENSYDFSCYVDESGNIVLTPDSNATQFESVRKPSEDDEVSIEELEDIITQEDDCSRKETTIIINANMLADESDIRVDTSIDNIGQCVVYPVNKDNVFVTATLNNSLNLVTESTSEEDSIKGSEEVPEVKATVVDEPVETTLDTVTTLTENFTERWGALRCTTLDECFECYSALQDHYKVTFARLNEGYAVGYSKMNESVDTEDIILRFLSGKISVFSDDQQPLESYVHIDELDSSGYEYYYDPETDAIVSYSK